jgi:2-polyprenyl-3-methyl-5-hydroxy-6-metoxy-1,4-benzoquinol methylase
LYRDYYPLRFFWSIAGFYRDVARLVDRAAPSQVLEVGCGEGWSTLRLREMLPSAVPLSALEIEDRLIAEARARNPGVVVDKGSIYGLERPSRSVDLVVCLEVLEHLDDPAQGLRELARVSGRHLLLSVPREPLWRGLNLARGKYVSSLGNTPGHLNHWSRRQFVRFVERVADVVVTRSPLPWTILLARVR